MDIRIPVTDKTGFTIAGGPAGGPTLGPVAFMHRASAAENPSPVVRLTAALTSYIAWDQYQERPDAKRRRD